MPTGRKTTVDKYDEIIKRLDTLERMLAERKHLDEKVISHEELISGNGKPGFKQVRDKILGWENKVNAIFIIIAGDVAIRIMQFASSNP